MGLRKTTGFVKLIFSTEFAPIKSSFLVKKPLRAPQIFPARFNIDFLYVFDRLFDDKEKATNVKSNKQNGTSFKNGTATFQIPISYLLSLLISSLEAII